MKRVLSEFCSAAIFCTTSPIRHRIHPLTPSFLVHLTRPLFLRSLRSSFFIHIITLNFSGLFISAFQLVVMVIIR